LARVVDRGGQHATFGANRSGRRIEHDPENGWPDSLRAAAGSRGFVRTSGDIPNLRSVTSGTSGNAPGRSDPTMS
jgi:hypothetical protein